MNNLRQWFKTEGKEWFDSAVIALILALFIRTFFIQAFKIPSGSMIPTLLINDRLMVNKMSYGPLIPFTKTRIHGYGKLNRGDIIVFKFPEDPKRDFIKRLIAFEGETVEIKYGAIYINGQIIDEPRIRKTFYYDMGQYGVNGNAVKVPSGHVFVLGDNSQSSHDSRYWGYVPVENIVGPASFIYWPLDRIRIIK
ncbi:MAG: signal peptidase I [Candidatus Omnitrophica bacterium]|nr:signal peptidase I [Candidatus Omnitrophota bacterium]